MEEYKSIILTPQPVTSSKHYDANFNNVEQAVLPPLAGGNNQTTNSANALNMVQNLHEIDTKKFLAEQINTDINKFRNAEAFINAGRERMQSMTNAANVANIINSAPNEIAEELDERESLRGEDLDVVDDNVSSLSKELLLAK